MKLFKYLSEGAALGFIKSPMLRLTQTALLNDPFEVRPSISDYFSISGGGIDPDSARMMFDGTSMHYGVISLSSSREKLLMWAHYADEHRGIVVQFNVPPDRFKLFGITDSHASGFHLFDKVKYEAKRDTSIAFNGQLGRDRKPTIDFYKTHFFRKSIAWRYEREWRFILPGKCATHIVPKDIHSGRDMQIAEILGKAPPWKISSFESVSNLWQAGNMREIERGINDHGLYSNFQDEMNLKIREERDKATMLFIAVDTSCIKQIYVGANADKVKYRDAINESNLDPSLFKQAELCKHKFGLHFEKDFLSQFQP